VSQLCEQLLGSKNRESGEGSCMFELFYVRTSVDFIQEK